LLFWILLILIIRTATTLKIARVALQRKRKKVGHHIGSTTFRSCQ